MYIYDISKPESPERLSLTSHFRSCDPVVAYGDLAFVTLNSSSGWWCGPSGNELHVYDITDLEYPKFLSSDTENLTSPKGLAVDGEQKLVFVCDSGGVKAFSFADPRDITPVYSSIHTEKVGRIDAYDCKILAPGRLLVVGSDGLFQLDYDPDPEKGFTFVSKINLKKDE
jgi:hypothetical protein